LHFYLFRTSKFICHTTATKEEAKIAHSIHKSSNFRAREAISLSEISLTCWSRWNCCRLGTLKCTGKIH
jgi:hypothetical protein